MSMVIWVPHGLQTITPWCPGLWVALIEMCRCRSMCACLYMCVHVCVAAATQTLCEDGASYPGASKQAGALSWSSNHIRVCCIDTADGSGLQTEWPLCLCCTLHVVQTNPRVLLTMPWLSCSGIRGIPDQVLDDAPWGPEPETDPSVQHDEQYHEARSWHPDQNREGSPVQSENRSLLDCSMSIREILYR